MLELLIMLFVGTQVNKLVTQKGLSKGWIAIVLAVPAAGFPVAFISAFVMTLSGMDPDVATLASIPVALLAEGLAAWGAIAFVKSRPDGVAPVYAQAPAPYVGNHVEVNIGIPSAPEAGGIQSAPASAVPAPAAPAAPRTAGYCSECAANVWLAADGSCSAGHDASCISNQYQV